MTFLSLRSLLLVALAASLLSGCAALGMRRSVPDEQLAKVHRIGVGSYMTQDFHMFHLGFTVFGNERSTSKVDWDINGFMRATTLDLLKRNPRLAPAPFDYQPAAGRAQDNPALWEQARREGFDHLVFIYPGVSQNHQLWEPNVGLTEQGGPFTARCVYAGYVVYVYSVETREDVGWQWGGKPDDICTPKDANDLPFRKRLEDYPPDEQAKIHALLNARIVKSMQQALETLDLVPTGK